MSCAGNQPYKGTLSKAQLSRSSQPKYRADDSTQFLTTASSAADAGSSSLQAQASPRSTCLHQTPLPFVHRSCFIVKGAVKKPKLGRTMKIQHLPYLVQTKVTVTDEGSHKIKRKVSLPMAHYQVSKHPPLGDYGLLPP